MNYPGFDRGISTGPTIGVDVNSSPQKVKRMTSSRFAKGAVAAALVAAIATNAAPISTGYTVPPRHGRRAPALPNPREHYCALPPPTYHDTARTRATLFLEVQETPSPPSPASPWCPAENYTSRTTRCIAAPAALQMTKKNCAQSPPPVNNWRSTSVCSRYNLDSLARKVT